MTGPIDQQIEKCLSFILEKPKDVACHAFTAYPERALREAVVNAFYHRSYEVSDPDPVKIHIKPDFIDIISYPGPDPTLKPEDFSENKVPPVQHRNRRIADFLKKLKLAEGMYTGVGTIFTSMRENIISFPDLLWTKPKARSGKVRKFVFLDWLLHLTPVQSPLSKLTRFSAANFL